MNYHSIAIDGPSGAGKSTLARMLAQELGYLYVDTGAIYRTVGLCAFRKGVEPTDARAVTALLDGMEIDLRYEQDGVQHMYLDVTPPTYPPSPRCARFCWSASGNWPGAAM